MKADAHTEAALMATLEQFKQAYEQRDMEHLLALFAPVTPLTLSLRETKNSVETKEDVVQYTY